MNNKKPRQRVSAACQGCRVKRTKCDGNPIQCSACRQRDQPCEYPAAEHNRKPPSKNYVRALEARVKVLEEELAALRNAPTSDPSNVIHGTSSSTPMARVSDIDVDVITDTFGSFNIGDGGTICYFGSCSNLNLLRSGVVGQKRKPSSQEMQQRAYQHHAVNEPIGLASVSAELRSHLLDLFWTWQNSWQRIVPQGLLLRDIAANPTSPSGKFFSPSLLCAIYSIASRYSDLPELRADPNDPQTAGDTFAAQAKFMLIHECEAPTTSTVQATALLSLREAGVDKEAVGWMYCGIAVRMALSLGLHLDCFHCVKDGTMSAEEAEVRCITWWGCYVTDKLWYIGLGRPSMIRDRDVTTKMPSTDCEEEYLPCPESRIVGHARATSPVSHIVSNSIYACKLFIMVAEVLATIYSPLTKDGLGDLVSSTQVRLMNFYQGLPSYLKISRSSQDVSPPHVYQLQPFLKSLRAPDGTIDGLDNNSIHTSVCQTSAGWIATIFRCYKGHYGLRTIPITAVHCAFTAAICFLAAATSSDTEIQGKAMQGLKCLYQCLEDMESTCSWSTRPILAIRNLARAWKVDLSRFSSERPEEAIPAASVLSGDTMPTFGSAAPGLEGSMDEFFQMDRLFEPFLDFGQDTPSSTLDWRTMFPFTQAEGAGEVYGDELH